MLPHVEFGPNDYREDALRFIKYLVYIAIHSIGGNKLGLRATKSEHFLNLGYFVSKNVSKLSWVKKCQKIFLMKVNRND